LVLAAIVSLPFLSGAQPASGEGNKAKPYKILTSGKRITIKSTKNIRSVIVWTSSGNRIVEQNELNESSFSFTVSNVSEKVLFIMIRYEDSRPFTEKIGI
jgi:hypothetical protein